MPNLFSQHNSTGGGNLELRQTIGNVDTRVKQRSRDTKRSPLMRRLVF
jgi:hypothetical protein